MCHGLSNTLRRNRSRIGRKHPAHSSAPFSIVVSCIVRPGIFADPVLPRRDDPANGFKFCFEFFFISYFFLSLLFEAEKIFITLIVRFGFVGYVVVCATEPHKKCCFCFVFLRIRSFNTFFYTHNCRLFFAPFKTMAQLW